MKSGPCCQNCGFFQGKKESIQTSWMPEPFVKETTPRCGKGGFAIKKMGWWKDWKPNA